MNEDLGTNVIVLPVIRIERREPRPGRVAMIRIGKRRNISVYAFTAEEVCVPLVELHGTTGEIDNLTVDQAEAIGDALIKAARKARGTA